VRDADLLMPHGAPTKTTLLTGRSLCLASYVLSLLVAVGDFFTPSAILSAGVSRSWTVGMALALVPLSLLGLAAVLTHRWRLEWIPASAITFLLLARAVPVWAVLPQTPGYLSAAAMMTLSGLCLGKRALDLWVFAIKTKNAKRAAEQPRDAR
jgi:hypothetical protein